MGGGDGCLLPLHCLRATVVGNRGTEGLGPKMKIRRIDFHSHPVLGDLSLDFLDVTTNSSANVVVLAGENGTGKTLVLNEVYSMLGEVDLGRSFAMDISLELDVDGLHRWGLDGVIPEGGLLDLKLASGDPHAPAWSSFRVTFSRGADEYVTSNERMVDMNRRPLSVFYSDAEISFRPGSISNVSTSTLDSGERVRRSGTGLAKEIAQLIIDLRAADAEDLAQWVEANAGSVPPTDVVERRIMRFRQAIETMFPAKRLARVGRGQENGLIIEFDEHGKTSSLEKLSMGEKQIVFRGGFLLRDLDLIQGGIVMVDEPELGLHPEWQSRIVGFYENLFPPTPTSSTQLIFTTHSPFLVHGQTAAKVVILRKDPVTGAISVDPEPSYPTTGQARVVNALNIPALIHQAQHDTIVLVEGETDVQILTAAWSKLRNGSRAQVEIRAALSDSAIRTTLKDDQLFAKNPGRKIVGLFDFDGAYNDWHGVWTKSAIQLPGAEADGIAKRHSGASGWALLLPVPAFRNAIASTVLGGDSALSIELMFEDAYHINGLVSARPLPAVDATVPHVNSRKKAEFALHVQGLGTRAFAAFEPLIKRIEDIKAGRI